MDVPFFINMPIPANRYAEVCALLAGTAIATVALAPGNAPASGDAKPDTAKSSDTEKTPGQESPASAGTGETATTGVSPSDEIDAHGWPWSAELHASTKGKTKDGLWRMKVGVQRPDPKPGFPVASGADTGTSQPAPTPSATSEAAPAAASAPAPTSGTEDEDEFAAFRAAAAASEQADAAAAASVPARKFSDADLGALCNQAAVKLGDPSPIKEIIARYVPEGQVAHSRNIPEDKRADFANEVEAKAGIEFAG